jgi:hypothetical protein
MSERDPFVSEPYSPDKRRELAANRAVPEVVERAGIRITGAGLPTNRRTDTDARLITAAVAPTQIRRPGRAVLRSTWQTFTGLCLLAPILVQVAGVDVAKLPWLVVPLAVAATVTRVMCDPRVEKILRSVPYLSWLAAAPAPPSPHV